MTSNPQPCALLGYTVAVNRPTGRDPERWEIVGGVHVDREPAENHQAWCKATAEADPDTYGADVRYLVVEVRVPLGAADPAATDSP